MAPYSLITSVCNHFVIFELAHKHNDGGNHSPCIQPQVSHHALTVDLGFKAIFTPRKWVYRPDFGYVL